MTVCGSTINWRQLLDKEIVPPIDPECSRSSDCRYISSRCAQSLTCAGLVVADRPSVSRPVRSFGGR